MRISFKNAIVLAAWMTCAVISAQPLVWDQPSKEYAAKSGETNVTFTFAVTNVAATNVVIRSVRTSCGCTVAKLPKLPWELGPGASGTLDVVMDFRGKRGTVSKVVSVDSTAGVKLLIVKVVIPEGDSRANNIMMALADRQAVFRNDCASCHVQPTIGKTGAALYATACGICHEAEHRASMVPDLKALNKPTDHAYWHTWVTKGKEKSLMPAFARAEGGPLDDQQVASLVEYLTQRFRPRPVVAPPAPPPLPQ
jgi:mono/diheme cytochrome c family protein